MAVIFNTLLKAGVSVDATDDDGNTPLHLACKSNAWESGILEFLISKKSKVNATNNKGQTPLHMATGEAWGQAISLLVKAGRTLMPSIWREILQHTISMVKLATSICKAQVNQVVIRSKSAYRPD